MKGDFRTDGRTETIANVQLNLPEISKVSLTGGRKVIFCSQGGLIARTSPSPTLLSKKVGLISYFIEPAPEADMQTST